MADYNSIHTGSEIDTAVSAVAHKQDKVAGVGFDFYGATAPAGSLACNGQEVSKSTYVELYSAIGDVWATTGGAAQPSTINFRLPPQEIGGLGLYNRGVGATNGAVGTYEEDVFKEHSHGINARGTGGGSNSAYIPANSDTGAYQTRFTATTGDTVETRPRSITVLKCIWTGL